MHSHVAIEQFPPLPCGILISTQCKGSVFTLKVENQLSPSNIRLSTLYFAIYRDSINVEIKAAILRQKMVLKVNTAANGKGARFVSYLHALSIPTYLVRVPSV